MPDYSDSIQPARERVASHPAIRQLLDPGVDPRVLHRFLIEYCALGVQITEPVDGWIRRAGERCKEIGLKALGDSLVKHAVHEAGHHLMFIDDCQGLSRLYAETYGEEVDADELLRQSSTPAMKRYIDLHERTIAGREPFAQVAIELEIEGLSVSLGPKLLEHLERVLGPAVVESCTFLREHVAVDVGHTALNNKMLERLVAAEPSSVPALAEAGSRALEAYLDFFGECLERARAWVTQQTASAPA